MTDRNGKCMCGAVRFTAHDPSREFGACHCKMCQRWAGSALLAVTVAEGDIDWQGSENIRRIQSSDWAERAWCDRCGSGLWYRVTAEGPHKGNYEIPIGLFDNADGLRMTREIFIDRKPDAFAFAGEHEVMTEAQVMAQFGPAPEGA
ncbi:MAG: GFA family protein [Pseudodonghicola sp.]|nr:GFA family protein [Pseudodonghicola sp.]